MYYRAHYKIVKREDYIFIVRSNCRTSTVELFDNLFFLPLFILSDVPWSVLIQKLSVQLLLGGGKDSL